MAIRMTKTGQYTVDFRLAHRRRRKTFATQAEARAFVRELALRPIDQLLDFKEMKSSTVPELVTNYLETVTKTKSPATQTLEMDVLRRFARHFEACDIRDLDLESIEQYQAHLRKTLAAETVNRHFNSIRHLLRKAVDWEYLTISPCDRLKRLKNDRQRTPKAFSNDEVRQLLEHAQPWLADAIFFMVKTALRRKELVFLRWGSIDFQNRCFHVEASEGFHPKGYKPRTLPMTEELFTFLSDKRRKAEALGLAKSQDYVFLNSVCNPVHPKALTKEMQRLRIKLKWERLGPHALRHTALTNMATRGVSSSIIQKVAGHSDGRMTERYVHLATADLLNGMEKLRDH